jgi:hypothetical protein
MTEDDSGFAELIQCRTPDFFHHGGTESREKFCGFIPGFMVSLFKAKNSLSREVSEEGKGDPFRTLTPTSGLCSSSSGLPSLK